MLHCFTQASFVLHWGGWNIVLRQVESKFTGFWLCVCVWDLIWIRRRNLLYLCHRYSSIIQLNHLFSRNFLEMEFVIFIVRINVNNACKCLIDHPIHKFRGYFIIYWSLSYYRVTLTFSACMFKVIKTIITLMFVIVI